VASFSAHLDALSDARTAGNFLMKGKAIRCPRNTRYHAVTYHFKEHWLLNIPPALTINNSALFPKRVVYIFRNILTRDSIYFPQKI
jgi:hypothetical protein